MADVTQILTKIQAGDQLASRELLPLIYDELRKLAQHCRRCDFLQNTSMVFLRVPKGTKWTRSKLHKKGNEMQTKNDARRLRFERLSQRNLLAGDCAVALEDGELTIECDAEDNELFVGSFLGQNAVTGTAGTTINGSSAPFIIGDAELEEIKIELGEGDDNLGLVFLTAEEITVDTGGGTDQIGALGVIAEEAKFDMGDGNDFLLVNASTFEEIKMDGGDGFLDVLFFGTNEVEEAESEGFEVGGI